MSSYLKISAFRVVAVTVPMSMSMILACSQGADFTGQSNAAIASAPDCRLDLSNSQIELGQSVQATLHTSATSLIKAMLNNIDVRVGDAVNFTPKNSGQFEIVGVVQNLAGSQSCKSVVEVSQPDNTQPVIPPSCAIRAVRQSPSSTFCNVTITSSGGTITADPELQGVTLKKISPMQWSGIATCDSAGRILTAEIKGANKLSGQCSVNVGAIQATACNINLSKTSITIGQSFTASVESIGGPVDQAFLNNSPVNVSQMVSFTPNNVGVFQLQASLRNASGLNTCTSSVNVAAAPLPIVVPPNCAISAVRQSPGSTSCNVMITSTGGPIIGDPSLNSLTPVTKSATGWTTSSLCSAAGQTITATVTGDNNTSRQCSVNVGAIQATACNINLSKTSITIGQSFTASVESIGGPVDQAFLNNSPVNVSQMVSFTPNNVGVFQLQASLRNASGLNTCTSSVNVAAAPLPIVVPPNCAISAVRQSPGSTSCNVMITSTGGPIIGDPSLNSLTPVTKSATGWTTSSLCSAAGQTITATVTGDNNTSKQCSVTVPAAVCTADLSYNPQQVDCTIKVADTESIWSHAGLPWTKFIDSFKDKEASWISPLQRVTTFGRVYCPFVPQAEKLIYVSHVDIAVDGDYVFESIVDDTGYLRLWKNADPDQEVLLMPGNNANPVSAGWAKIGLTAGRYSIIVDALDVGRAATGMVMSIKGADGTVLKRSTNDGSWCIFRVASIEDVKAYVPKAAACRACFNGGAN